MGNDDECFVLHDEFWHCRSGARISKLNFEDIQGLRIGTAGVEIYARSSFEFPR